MPKSWIANCRAIDILCELQSRLGVAHRTTISRRLLGRHLDGTVCARTALGKARCSLVQIIGNQVAYAGHSSGSSSDSHEFPSANLVSQSSSANRTLRCVLIGCCLSASQIVETSLQDQISYVVGSPGARRRRKTTQPHDGSNHDAHTKGHDEIRPPTHRLALWGYS